MNEEWLFTCVSLGEAEAYGKEGLLEKCAEYFLPEEDGGGPGIQDGEAVQWYVFSAVDNASSTLASWGVGGDVGKTAQSQILSFVFDFLRPAGAETAPANLLLPLDNLPRFVVGEVGNVNGIASENCLL